MSRISHLRFRKNGTYVTDTILRDYGKSFRASNKWCAYCGHQFTKRSCRNNKIRTKDHVVPKSKENIQGGSGNITVYSCRECNAMKEDKSLLSFLMELREL